MNIIYTTICVINFLFFTEILSDDENFFANIMQPFKSIYENEMRDRNGFEQLNNFGPMFQNSFSDFGFNKPTEHKRAKPQKNSFLPIRNKLYGNKWRKLDKSDEDQRNELNQTKPDYGRVYIITYTRRTNTAVNKTNISTFNFKTQWHDSENSTNLKRYVQILINHYISSPQYGDTAIIRKQLANNSDSSTNITEYSLYSFKDTQILIRNPNNVSTTEINLIANNYPNTFVAIGTRVITRELVASLFRNPTQKFIQEPYSLISSINEKDKLLELSIQMLTNDTNRVTNNGNNNDMKLRNESLLLANGAEVNQSAVIESTGNTSYNNNFIRPKHSLMSTLVKLGDLMTYYYEEWFPDFRDVVGHSKNSSDYHPNRFKIIESVREIFIPVKRRKHLRRNRSRRANYTKFRRNRKNKSAHSLKNSTF